MKVPFTTSIPLIIVESVIRQAHFVFSGDPAMFQVLLTVREAMAFIIPSRPVAPASA
jgi:hypothetical protein